MTVGIWPILQGSRATPLQNFLAYFIGGDVLHDVLVAPVAALIGVLVVRRAPAVARSPLRAALFASVVVVAVAWPALRGFGRDQVPDNSSVQPLNYATAVATVLGVVWVLAGLWLAVNIVRARSQANPRAATTVDP
jgi:hypothetical protein